MPFSSLLESTAVLRIVVASGVLAATTTSKRHVEGLARRDHAAAVRELGSPPGGCVAPVPTRKRTAPPSISAWSSAAASVFAPAMPPGLAEITSEPGL